MRSKSLQKKLFINYVLSIFLGFILFSFALFLLLTSGLYKKVDDTLISEYKWIETFLKDNIRFGEKYVMEETAEHISPNNKDLYAMILSKDRKIVFLSENLKNENFLLNKYDEKEIDHKSYNIRSLEIEKVYKNDIHLRLLIKRIVLPLDNKDYLLAIATPVNDIKSIQKQLIFWLLIIIPLIGIPFALWSKFSAKKISRPLEIMSNRAKKVTINRLSENIEIPLSYKEVEDLTESFNEMIQRLKRSILEIKRFTSDASHELRTPLAVLKSQIQVALREREIPPEFRRILEEEFNEVIYMEKIVNNLLFLSRFDSAEIKMENSIVDLSDLVIEQCEKMKIFAKSKNVRIILGHIDPVKVLGDKTCLTQMISNLVDNAIKYNKQGGKVYVDLSLPLSNSCSLRIKDTGIGIPKDEISHIFDRFYRVDKSRSRKIMGSGLGLSIVKLIAELHHGDINIKSEKDQGTAITISLPICSE